MPPGRSQSLIARNLHSPSLCNPLQSVAHIALVQLLGSISAFPSASASFSRDQLLLAPTPRGLTEGHRSRCLVSSSELERLPRGAIETKDGSCDGPGIDNWHFSIQSRCELLESVPVMTIARVHRRDVFAEVQTAGTIGLTVPPQIITTLR